MGVLPETQTQESSASLPPPGQAYHLIPPPQVEPQPRSTMPPRQLRLEKYIQSGQNYRVSWLWVCCITRQGWPLPGLGPPGGKSTLKIPACHHPPLPPALDPPSAITPLPQVQGQQPPMSPQPGVSPWPRVLSSPALLSLRTRPGTLRKANRVLASGVKIKGIPKNSVTKINKNL